jgi:hypothetical protein
MPKMKEVSIERYEEKIAWAKTQDPDGFPIGDRMRNAIWHSWTASSCPYCQKYYNKLTNTCNTCLLYDDDDCYENDSDASEYCCSGLWAEMNCSKTWSEWISNAEKVLEYIKEHG